MKTKLLLSVALFLFTVGITDAQKVKLENTDYTYIRLPINPLPKEVKTFIPSIEMTYVSNSEKIAKENEDRKKAAQERYDEEMKAYKESSTGKKLAEKILLDEEKPKLERVEDVYVPVIYDIEDLSIKYIQLPGFEKSDNADVKVIIKLNGFSISEIVDATTIKKEKKGDAKVDVTYYLKKVKHKHPMTLIILNNNDEILYEEVYTDFDTYKKSSSSSFRSKKELNKYWNENKNSFLRSLDEKNTNANLKIIKANIASMFGFTPITRKESVGTVKPGKFQYDEYTESYENLILGFNYLETSAYPTDAYEYFENAIELLKPALEEYVPGQKKARINEKIASMTHYNMALAYIWLNKFTEADKHINKVIVMKKHKREALSLRKFMKEQKERYNANNANN